MTEGKTEGLSLSTTKNEYVLDRLSIGKLWVLRQYLFYFLQ